MTLENIKEIIQKYDVQRIMVPDVFPDGGVDPLWPRFERAVSNQIEDGTATVSRYGIWANTVRDNIREAIALIEFGKLDEAITFLIRATNSMSAFSEVQQMLDYGYGETQEDISTLWLKFNKSSNRLTSALGRTGNIVGEYAEHLTHNFYGGKLLDVSNVSADIEDFNGKLYQVKSRKIGSNLTTQLNVIRSWNFDYLIVILFNKSGSISKALEVPSGVAKEYGVKNIHQNGWIITTSRKFINDKRSKDITIPMSIINKET